MVLWTCRHRVLRTTQVINYPKFTSCKKLFSVLVSILFKITFRPNNSIFLMGVRFFNQKVLTLFWLLHVLHPEQKATENDAPLKHFWDGLCPKKDDFAFAVVKTLTHLRLGRNSGTLADWIHLKVKKIAWRFVQINVYNNFEFIIM